MNLLRHAAACAVSALILLVPSPLLAGKPSSGIPGGVDLFRTPQATASFALQPIPANFFGPGSLPFEGNVQLTGLPLIDVGAFDVGDADTVIQRNGPLEAGPNPPPIAIEIVELRLQSVAPILVQTIPPSQWDVEVDLAPRPTPQGVLGINPFPEGGGSFTLELPVRPVFTFTQVDNPANVQVLPAFDVVLTGNAPYDSGADCPEDARLLPVIGSGDAFCPASQDGLRMPFSLGSPSLQLQLELAATEFHGSPNVHPTAICDPTAELGHDVVVGPGARIGRNAVIGAGTQVGADARIGPDSVIGAGVSIGDGARLSASCFVDDGASIGPDVTLQRNVVIGAGTSIGAGSRLGGGASVGADSTIGTDVTIGGRTRVGHHVSLDDRARVRGGLRIADGSALTDLLVDFDTFTCQLLSDTQPMTAEDCEQAGGHVYGHIGDIFIGDNPDITVTEEEPVLPDPPDLEDAQDALDDSGIPDKEYVTDTYDCDDFAGDAEKKLEEEGFDATFTVYWRWEPRHQWVNRRWVGAWVDGHAVLDVHVGGTIKWLEPQKKSTDPGGNELDLDFDGDGTVEYDTEHGSALTDGSYRIEVYDSREAAEAAGVVMD